MTNRSIVAALACAVLVAPGLAHAAKPARVFTQAGKDLPGQMADETTCTDYAKGVPTPGLPPPMAVNGGAAAAAGAALATGFLAGLEEAKVRRASYERCMRARGYTKVALTPEEETALKAVRKQPEREAWFAALLARPDLVQRIEAAKGEVVDLPPVPDAKASAAGLVFDLAQAKVAEGVVAEGGALLTLPAGHLATARLAVDYPVSNMLGINKRGEAGAVFHAVARGPYIAQWCGPFVNGSVQGKITQMGCVETAGDGFKVVNVGGETWLAGELFVGGFPVDDGPKLEASAEDLIGPVTVTFKLDKITKKGVRLSAVGERDGKTVRVWTGGGNFDADGRLVTPLWSHRLILTRSGDGVAAVLGADGDGRDWYGTAAP